MLAALVPRPEGPLWSFKVNGPPAEMEKLAAAFREFIGSLTFPKPDEPKWRLPEGWTETPGSGMRFATIHVPLGEAGAPSAELSVIPLPTPEESEETYLLANINRWRGQLQLPLTSAEKLREDIERIPLAEGEAVLVDLTGLSGGGGPMGGPFAGPRSAPPQRPAPQVAENPRAGGPSAGSVPEGWEKSSGSSLSVLAYKAGEGAEVTLTPLGAAAAELTSNINRWRGQIGLAPNTEEQIAAAVKKVSLGGNEGSYVKLIGEEKAILGTIAVVGETAWFLKLTGTPAAAEREEANFNAFARNLKFE